MSGSEDAFVFVRNGSSWALQATLKPSDTSFGAFGRSLAIDGDTAVIGAWLADGVRFSTGAAYVFLRNGSTWTQQSKLVAADGEGADRFGYNVAISGNTVLVGAPGDDLSRGSAYVFLRNGNTWTQQSKLIPTDAAAGDELTWPEGLALHGDTAIVGSYSKKSVAYAFIRNGSSWSQQSKLLPTGGSLGFGWDIAVRGDVAVFSSGHVFERVGGAWLPRAAFAGYNSSVSFDGTRIIAGDPYLDGLAAGSGTAHVYRLNSGYWSEEAKLAASDGAYIDGFGRSVDVSGDYAVVGAPNDDNLGSAYAFKLPDTVPTGLRFVALPPCRLMETRSLYNFEGRTGAFGPPSMSAGETRTLNLLQQNVCPIPPSATAYVLNATLVPRGSVDFVTVWPGSDPRPTFWTVRSPDGQIVANSAIVKATNGLIQVFTSDTSDLLLDISGYFTDDVQVPSQAFYPLTPCRVIDTRLLYRSPAGPFGPPTMAHRKLGASGSRRRRTAPFQLGRPPIR